MKKLWVLVSQFFGETQVNKVKPSEKYISLFFSGKDIFPFDQGNFCGELAHYQYQGIILFFTQRQGKDEVKHQHKEEH